MVGVTMTPESAIGIQMTFVSIMLVFAGARFMILRHQLRTTSMIISDFLLVFGCFQIVTCLCMITYKNSAHMNYIAQGKGAQEIEILMLAVIYRKFLFVSGVLYTNSLWTIKSAFLCLYWNFFKRVQGNVRWVLNGAIVFTFAAFLVVFVGLFAWCTPIQINWSEDLLAYATCTPIASIRWTLTAASINILNDIVLIIVPMSILSHLNFSRRETLALILVFGVGIVSVVAATVRMGMVYRALATQNTGATSQNPLETWSVIELCLANIAFCLPAFRVLIVHRKSGSSLGKSSHSGVTSRAWHTKTGNQNSMAKKSMIETDIELSKNDGSQEHLRSDDNGIIVHYDISVTSQTK